MSHQFGREHRATRVDDESFASATARVQSGWQSSQEGGKVMNLSRVEGVKCLAGRQVNDVLLHSMKIDWEQCKWAVGKDKEPSFGNGAGWWGRDRLQLEVAGGLSWKNSLRNHRERHFGGDDFTHIHTYWEENSPDRCLLITFVVPTATGLTLLSRGN